MANNDYSIQNEKSKGKIQNRNLLKKKLNVGSGAMEEYPLLTGHTRHVLFVVIAKTKTSEQQ